MPINVMWLDTGLLVGNIIIFFTIDKLLYVETIHICMLLKKYLYLLLCVSKVMFRPSSLLLSFSKEHHLEMKIISWYSTDLRFFYKQRFITKFSNIIEPLNPFPKDPF